MKDISTNTLTVIINMAALIVFFIWGYLDSFQHSWLVFLVSGLITVAIRMIRKDKEEAEKKREQ